MNTADKMKINEALKEKVKTLTINELEEKIRITRETQLNMLKFQNIKAVKRGEDYVKIFQDELKKRNIEYNGKDKDFLEVYYGLAEIIAEDYEQFEEMIKIIEEEIE